MRTNIKKLKDPNKKSQVAMENLATYAWAILIVIIAVAAMSYFGVLNVKDLFVPKRCVLSAGITCLDFSISASGFTVVLQNNIGETIIIDEVKLTEKGGSSCSTSPSVTLGANQKILVTILGCINGDIGDKFLGEIEVTYTKQDGGLDHKLAGDIKGKISSEGSAISQSTCQNAEDNGLCDGLDIVFGSGYKQACCDDYNICLAYCP